MTEQELIAAYRTLLDSIVGYFQASWEMLGPRRGDEPVHVTARRELFEQYITRAKELEAEKL